MYTRLYEMNDNEILTIWDNLRGYDASEMYDAARGISMDEWAGMVYSEMLVRGLSTLTIKVPYPSRQKE